MSSNSFNLYVVKRAIISVLVIASTLILLDLYVPLKRMLCGDKLTFIEIVSYLTIRDQFSSILTIGMMMVGRSVRKEEDSTTMKHKK